MATSTRPTARSATGPGSTPWRRFRTRCGPSSPWRIASGRTTSTSSGSSDTIRSRAGPDELLPLLDRLLTGQAEAQHELFRRIEEPARRAGFGDVVDGWEPDVRWLRGEGGYRDPVKKRLDVLLVERGLAESRAQAQALVLAGLVPGYDKPGQQVEEDAELAVEQPPPYVSRGGEKLAHGLDALGVDPAGLDCVDVGASTGGFTDVLLQRGAARVIALDVGYGQLHPRLRSDPRVDGARADERAHARRELPFAPQLVVCDVSFICVRIALPPVLRLCAPGWQAVVLVKPQFEAGRADVGKGGVVRDDEVRRRVVREVAEAALGVGRRACAAS